MKKPLFFKELDKNESFFFVAAFLTYVTAVLISLVAGLNDTVLFCTLLLGSAAVGGPALMLFDEIPNAVKKTEGSFMHPTLKTEFKIFALRIFIMTVPVGFPWLFVCAFRF